MQLENATAPLRGADDGEPEAPQPAARSASTARTERCAPPFTSTSEKTTRL